MKGQTGRPVVGRLVVVFRPHSLTGRPSRVFSVVFQCRGAVKNGRPGLRLKFLATVSYSTSADHDASFLVVTNKSVGY